MQFTKYNPINLTDLIFTDIHGTDVDHSRIICVIHVLEFTKA